MALNATQKTQMYQFFSLAFGAAPGVTYMNQLDAALNSGMSLVQVVEEFTKKSQFTDTYPTFWSFDQFAKAFVNNNVGSFASEAVKAAAVADIVGALTAGWSRGKVITQVFTNIAAKAATDADWGTYAKVLAADVAYAQYYTEVIGGTTTDLAVLRAVIANTGPNTSTATADIANAFAPPASSTAFSTANAAAVTAQTASATAAAAVTAAAAAKVAADAASKAAATKAGLTDAAALKVTSDAAAATAAAAVTADTAAKALVVANQTALTAAIAGGDTNTVNTASATLTINQAKAATAATLVTTTATAAATALAATTAAVKDDTDAAAAVTAAATARTALVSALAAGKTAADAATAATAAAGTAAAAYKAAAAATANTADDALGNAATVTAADVGTAAAANTKVVTDATAVLAAFDKEVADAAAAAAAAVAAKIAADAAAVVAAKVAADAAAAYTAAKTASDSAVTAATTAVAAAATANAAYDAAAPGVTSLVQANAAVTLATTSTTAAAAADTATKLQATTAAALKVAATATAGTADDAVADAAVTAAATAAAAGTKAVADAKSDADTAALVPPTYAPKTFLFTTGVDIFTGDKGDDTFNATATGTANGLDAIDGAAGANDVLNVLDNTAAVSTLGMTVKGVETANFSSVKAVTVDASKWTGLNALNVGYDVGFSSITAATTTAVTVSAHSDGDLTVAGGSSQTITSSAVGTDKITLSGAKGAVALTASVASAFPVNGGQIDVTGGTTVSVNQNLTQLGNGAITAGTVNVTGSADTTSVSVINTKPVANKIIAGTINVTDGATDKAGTITAITASGYTSLGIKNNALTTLSVTNGSGNVIIDNSGLKTPTNTTLALTADGLTGGTLDDADIYTTLNVTTANNASKLANITFGAATALNVAGAKGLELTSAAGLTALKTVTVTGTAGLTADLSGATVTGVDASGTSGSNKITVDAAKASFTGGSGVDSVTTKGEASKAIALGDGNDSLVYGGAAVPTGTITGGAGTDTLSISAAVAALGSDTKSGFSGKVSGFEKLVLTGSTNQTIDTTALGNYTDISTSKGNGLTLDKLASGSTLTLTGAGTAYTLSNSAWAATTDSLNLVLTADGSQTNTSFTSAQGGITAAKLETVAITVTDTQETPTGTVINSVTWSGNDAKTITVTGNAGLNLTATSTALTSVDASGITGTKDTGGFTFTSGALAAAASVKGSAAADNTIDFSAAVTKAVSYTGGTGRDAITGTNGKDNVVDLGDGKNSFTGAAGKNTVTGGKDADTVTLTSGNNTVSLGDGDNGFTATSGNNTYTGGKGVDTVTVENGNNTITTGAGNDVISVGGGLNIVSMGAGNDALSISARPINGNIFTTVTDINVGDTINLAALTTADSKGGALGSKINLADTAAFADYLAAAAAGVIVSNPTGPSTMAWFQFGGNTFIVVDDTNPNQNQNIGPNQSADNNVFENGIDSVVKLTGLVDLSTSTIATDVLTIVAP